MPRLLNVNNNLLTNFRFIQDVNTHDVVHLLNAFLVQNIQRRLVIRSHKSQNLPKNEKLLLIKMKKYLRFK